MTNQISVLIIAFSVERCLESVFSQELKSHEIIVINDGSTDNTSEILMEPSQINRQGYWPSPEANGVEACGSGPKFQLKSLPKDWMKLAQN